MRGVHNTSLIAQRGISVCHEVEGTEVGFDSEALKTTSLPYVVEAVGNMWGKVIRKRLVLLLNQRKVHKSATMGFGELILGVGRVRSDIVVQQASVVLFVNKSLVLFRTAFPFFFVESYIQSKLYVYCSKTQMQ